MVKLSRLLCATMLSVLAAISAGKDNPEGMIYFLNIPETIRKPGIIHEQKILKDGRSRIFWHYKNSTNSAQQFNIRLSEKNAGTRFGQSVSSSPPTAGTRAMLNFLKSSPRPEKYLNETVVVPRGYTVSGVAEGIWNKGATIKANLGKGNKVPGIVQVANPHLFVEQVAVLSSTKTVKLSIGQNKPGHISGNYGSTIRTSFKSNLAIKTKIRVSFSPRGGPLNLIYIYNGKVICSPRVAAKKDYTLFYVWLSSGQQVNLDVYPLGGFNYPVEIRFTPIK
jgi:hypothetical protein